MYAIYNEEKKKFFKNNRGHVTFSNKSAASNSFNYKNYDWRKPSDTGLGDRKDWKLVKVKLKIVEDTK